jgi:hypothetical protein
LLSRTHGWASIQPIKSRIANEQEQGVGGLVEVAIPQVMARQRAAAYVIGLGTGPAGLFVSAAMEMPVALELGATDSLAELLVNVAPGRPPVLLHVIVSHRPEQPGQGAPDQPARSLINATIGRFAGVSQLFWVCGRDNGGMMPFSDCRTIILA